jgi:hypothetical protein
MRLLRHLVAIGICIGVMYLFLFWSVYMSMQTFVTGRMTVPFTQSEVRNSAIGDACITVIFLPARLLGLSHEMGKLFGLVIDGLLFYTVTYIVFTFFKRKRLPPNRPPV